MKTRRFEVLSQSEVERIHAASMEILAEVGIKVSYQTARDVYREAGAIVDDQAESVKIPEKLVNYAIEQAPSEFKLYGGDPEFQLQIGGDQSAPVFAGLGTPTRVMVGLHYLKHTFNESDESVVERFVENPYWQYFCGFEFFQHEFPIDPSSMTRWRNPDASPQEIA